MGKVTNVAGIKLAS